MLFQIPERFLIALRNWLAAKKTGQITFHVKDGGILAIDFLETIR